MIESPDIKKKKRSMTFHEQALQIQCVQWFRLQYPKYKDYLFHIPNGGSRSFKIDKKGNRWSPEAQRLKLMGVLPGVSDLFLAFPKDRWAGLWVEMKAGKGKLTDAQKTFQDCMVKVEYRVATISSLEGFMELINGYFHKTSVLL